MPSKRVLEVETHIRFACAFLESNGPQLASMLGSNPEFESHLRESLWLTGYDRDLLIIPRKVEPHGILGPDCLWSVHPEWEQNLIDIIERDRLSHKLWKEGKYKEHRELTAYWQKRLGI